MYRTQIACFIPLCSGWAQTECFDPPPTVSLKYFRSDKYLAKCARKITWRDTAVAECNQNVNISTHIGNHSNAPVWNLMKIRSEVLDSITADRWQTSHRRHRYFCSYISVNLPTRNHNKRSGSCVRFAVCCDAIWFLWGRSRYFLMMSKATQSDVTGHPTRGTNILFQVLSGDLFELL